MRRAGRPTRGAGADRGPRPSGEPGKPHRGGGAAPRRHAEPAPPLAGRRARARPVFQRLAGLAGLAAAAGLALAGAIRGAASPEPVAPPPEPAALVLRGAAVYTVDAARSSARAVAVRAGRIVYVGSEAGAGRWIGADTRVLDLAGGMVLPGFQDAHIHPVMSGVEIGQCDLSGFEDRDRLLERVRSCAAEQTGEWLIGAGWQLPLFPGGNPDRALLDAIAGDRPAYLAAADGHSAWVSSRALALAGVGAATPDPPGGRIERRPDGEPTGTLRENAIALVAPLVPVPSLEERVAGLLHAQELLLAHGVTAVQESSAGIADLEAYQAAAGSGALRLEVVAALDTDLERGPEQAAELAALRRRFTAPGLRPTAAKIFLDGVIEARTAAMLEPYDDRPGDRGELGLPPERLDPLVAALAREGFDVHVHAIGDRAVRAALDAFERAAGGGALAYDDGRPRHQIAHLEVVHPDDVPRFRRLGVVALFQPLWAFADSYIVDLTWPALGAVRSRWIYPLGSVHRAGGALAFGSDWSVSSLDPLEGIEVAVTRRDPAGGGRAAMQPDEALDLPAAIAAYTAGAAWANRLEAETGSIEVGKAADLVVLADDLFALPPDRISETRVLLTLIDGAEVYRADGAPAFTRASGAAFTRASGSKPPP